MHIRAAVDVNLPPPPRILLDATESCFELVLRGICDPRTSANVLLAGKRGSGKSTALASIAKRLAADPNHVYPRIVNCKRMVGELQYLVIIVRTYIRNNLTYVATSLTAINVNET